MNAASEFEKYLSSDNAVLICCQDGKNTICSHNAGLGFRSASVIKIFILAYYLHENASFERIINIPEHDRIEFSSVTELGLASAGVGWLLSSMIASSDNTSTNILINDAGMDNVNRFCRGILKTKNTVLGRKMLDYAAAERGEDNITCLNDARACLSFCMEYEQGKRILSMQKCRDRTFRYIYDNIPFYGKAGEIPGVFNDVGIIGGVFAGVLTRGMKPEDAEKLCGLCGLAAYNEYIRKMN